jgi:hypothetical protein
MKALDDSDRERYRLDLLDQVLAERFPVTPWWEAHRKPIPLEFALLVMANKANRERRQAALLEMDEHIGRRA